MKLSDLIASGAFHQVKTSRSYDCDEYFLQDSIREKARERLAELLKKNLIPSFDIDTMAEGILYSLSYSQVDGVSFSETSSDYCEDKRNGLEYYFRIVRNSSRYVHECTFEGHFEECCGVNSTNEQHAKLYTRAEQYTKTLRELCQELEKYGYEIMEADQEYNSLRDTCRAFAERNAIMEDSPEDFFESSRATFDSSELESPVLIGECGGTNVYVKDLELSEHQETVVRYAI
jgi:hypothetical protein